MMKTWVRGSISAVVCLLLLALTVSVHAQGAGQGGQHQQGQQMMQQPGSDVQVTDADLEKVAEAYVEIHEIRLGLQESLAGVSDPETAQKLQEEAGESMIKAVQTSGIDVNTYNQVMQVVQSDPELREKLTAKLESME